MNQQVGTYGDMAVSLGEHEDNCWFKSGRKMACLQGELAKAGDAREVACFAGAMERSVHVGPGVA